MTTAKTEPRWLQRLSCIDSRVAEIVLPDGLTRQDGISQDEEWCEIVVDGGRRRIRFHDYHEIFRIPGLYESLFYERLKCCAPSVLAHLIVEVLGDFGLNAEQLRVMDLGAGNGMVGDELHSRGVRRIVGVDILPEAREATFRDRPDVYDDYLVLDMTRITNGDEQALRSARFNCLTSVAALGFGDIPPEVFLKALSVTQHPSWVAFTIKEDFLQERESTGFASLIQCLIRRDVLQIQTYRRFRHRLSVTGTPLYYVAMVARKLKDVSTEFLEEVRFEEEPIQSSPE